MKLFRKNDSPNIKLDMLIKNAVEIVNNMTPEQMEIMLKKQAASWARQDLD